MTQRTVMMRYYVSLLIAVAGSVLYHFSMKQVPRDSNPFFALLVAYLAAALLSAILLFGFEGEKTLSPAHFGVALGILGIETGFLLAYRAGWSMGYASLTANTLSTLILLPVGLLLFSERLSPQKGVGIALCLAGLGLLLRAA